MSMKRILVVDDEPHVIRLMRLALERAGYEVDTAADGNQAMQCLARAMPDAMITDIDMPRMNGASLCMEIHRSMPERQFRIYVVTARAEIEHREWSSRLPELVFMEKPVSIRRLVASLDAYFSDNAQCRIPESGLT
jgi:CheY-like chemotaxis protein